MLAIAIVVNVVQRPVTVDFCPKWMTVTEKILAPPMPALFASKMSRAVREATDICTLATVQGCAGPDGHAQLPADREKRYAQDQINRRVTK